MDDDIGNARTVYETMSAMLGQVKSFDDLKQKQRNAWIDAVSSVVKRHQDEIQDLVNSHRKKVDVLSKKAEELRSSNWESNAHLKTANDRIEELERAVIECCRESGAWRAESYILRAWLDKARKGSEPDTA